jgi:poly-gamma-glutamate capsule biosynthesis protein CapA/YwtB (metallophosphatase superfamily)
MLVYYSLGNFIFDQYWNEGVSHGLALILHVAADGMVTAVEHPTEILRDGRVCPLVQEAVI